MSGQSIPWRFGLTGALVVNLVSAVATAIDYTEDPTPPGGTGDGPSVHAILVLNFAALVVTVVGLYWLIGRRAAKGDLLAEIRRTSWWRLGLTALALILCLHVAVGLSVGVAAVLIGS